MRKRIFVLVVCAFVLAANVWGAKEATTPDASNSPCSPCGFVLKNPLHPIIKRVREAFCPATSSVHSVPELDGLNAALREEIKKTPEQFDTIYLTPEMGNMGFLTPVSHLFENVYLGNIDGFYQIYENNNPFKFAYVISLYEGKSEVTVPIGVQRRKILVLDAVNAWDGLQKLMPKAFNLIDQARREKKPILIHCQAGISRSASVVIAYLMKRCNVTFKESLAFIRTKRSCVCPNPGFRKGLQELETSGKHSSIPCFHTV